MKFGLRYCNTGRYNDPKQAIALMQAAEAAGFESAWTVEHIVIPEGYQSAYPYSPTGKLPGSESGLVLPDPLIWMAYVAAATSRIKLATGIIILPEHNPVLCAKQVATLDHLCGGRVILGIGVGWLKEEFDALGVPFEPRGRMTDEYIAAMRELWTSDAPTFHGEFVHFEKAHMRPRPAQGPVPIVIGGHTKAAARRAGRIGDGFFPARGSTPELVELVRQTARDCGRDPAAVEITVSCPEDLDEIPALERLGVARVTVPVMANAGLTKRIAGPEDVLAWREAIDRHRR
ncbi:MAG: LLM class F420-dependent oxidoreductase [Acetobacteraceae bacterium]